MQVPLPIPADEMQRMRNRLAPNYGSELWEQEGQRVLVIRTPGVDPDVVNDLEAAIEYLSPADVRDLHVAVLTGSSRSTAIAPGPLEGLMDQRIERDHQMAALLRGQIPGRQGHIVYRAPGEPKRFGRLGIRVPHAKASEIDDDDLDILADEMGPRIDTAAFSNVVGVYILADQDEVRVEADLFLQAIRNRFLDEDRRRAQEAEDLSRAEADKVRRARDRDEIKRLLSSRYERSSRIGDEVDRRLRDRGSGWPEARRPKVGSNPLGKDSIREEPRIESKPTAGPDGTAATRQALEAAGYEVLVSPPVGRHKVDLAAERDDHPQRIIVRVVPFLDRAVADEVLTATEALHAQMALIVAPEADGEARERLIATRAKWVAPRDLVRLDI